MALKSAEKHQRYRQHHLVHGNKQSLQLFINGRAVTASRPIDLKAGCPPGGSTPTSSRWVNTDLPRARAPPMSHPDDLSPLDQPAPD